MNSVQSYFDSLLVRIPKVYGVLVTDRDGVTLVKAMTPLLKDAQIDPALSSSFSAAAEQSSKLNLGVHLSCVCFYDNYTLVQINLLPIVVSIIAQPDVNVQLIRNCMAEIHRVLEPVRLSVQQTVMQTSTHEQ